VLADLHLRATDCGSRPPPVRPVRESRVSETTQAGPRPEQKSGFRAWWDSKTPIQLSEYVIVAGCLTVVVLGSILLSNSFAHNLLTNVWWYGIAASSLIFLSAY